MNKPFNVNTEYFYFFIIEKKYDDGWKELFYADDEDTAIANALMFKSNEVLGDSEIRIIFRLITKTIQDFNI